MIPKIIHQMAPEDKSKWSKLWHTCQKSVLDNFSDFAYEMWTHERVNNFVRTEYSQWFEAWSSLPLEIMKIDIARLMIIHKYGGIYLDMDVFVYKNFYSELTSDICLVGTFSEDTSVDPCENFLFAGIPNHNFWIYSFKDCFERLKNFNVDEIKKATLKENCQINVEIVNYVCGQSHLSDIYLKYKRQYDIKVLPFEYFNQSFQSYDPCYFTKHMFTGIWGKEYYDAVDNVDEQYVKDRGIDIKLDDFDFYTNYQTYRDFEIFPSLVTIFQNTLKLEQKKQLLKDGQLTDEIKSVLNSKIEQYRKKFSLPKVEITLCEGKEIEPKGKIYKSSVYPHLVGVLFPMLHNGHIELQIDNPNNALFGISDYLHLKKQELTKYSYGFYKWPTYSGDFFVFPSWLNFRLLNSTDKVRLAVLFEISFILE